ncbi:amino acid adenylation domain-containing protein (plasmid) [Burkholderia glumae]|uniref:non-ribosomal peptide synthetase n=1 Tax=Burkholderia glumae TaxID=337 RepID=UPI00215119DA|nr:amino acid adenylation domain-containing protein [Burkholderia glumae]UVS82798.1 amino acid adenylation domain-containing protein [Burkholderia glumae]UVT00243.1 amino acid adenylation domain-containing protein [Burkholderia glumae]
MRQTVNGRQLHDLAPSQIPEWYAYQFDPDSAVYNISFNHFFLDCLDRDAFLHAWQALMDRHDVFRIRMTYAEGRPRQYLGEPVCLHADTLFIDRTGLAPDSLDAEQERLARDYALQPFDFERDRLFRLHLVSYPGDTHQLIFTVHHIIWDETSTLNMIREFVALYEARQRGTTTDLPTLSSGFLDYADRINAELSDGRLERSRQYWLTRFADLPPPLDLPTDRPRPSIQTYRGDTVKIWLPRQLARDLNGFCGRHNITLFMLLLAVLDLYFYRISGQSDFVLGCPIAGRESRDKPLLGCFAVPMPIRCRVVEGMTFADLLRQVAETVLGAFEHHRYPCVSMIEQLSHQKDLSRPKLFSVMAGVQNDKSEFVSIRVGEGSLHAKDVFAAENHGARFDLAIGLDPVGSDVKFFCTYNSDLYDRETIEGMLSDLGALFAQVIAEPVRALTHYTLLAPETAQRVLVDFNRTAMTRQSGQTVIDLFLAQAALQPDAPAVEADDAHWRYGELAARVASLARALQQAGVVRGDFVAVLMEASGEQIATMLALMSLGAVYVPLHEAWPDDRLADAAGQIGFRLAVASAALRGRAAVLGVPLLAEAAGGGAQDGRPPACHARPGDLAYLLFTSGTTGKPKGIPIPHDGLHNLVVATQARYALNGEDRVLYWTSPTFDAAMLDTLWPLASGAVVVVWPQEQAKAPRQALAWIDARRITVLQTVPLMLDALAEARAASASTAATLRLIICGAAALGAEVRERARSAFGCRLANHYGPTEVGVDALWFDCDEAASAGTTPIGRPLPNVQAFVLDRRDQPVPIGVPGQICIASPGLSPGYWGAPEASAAAFLDWIPPVGGPALRLYRTGDIGKLDRLGRMHYIGRLDKQVKVRGNRVELGDVESALARHPAVAKAAVVWQEDGGGSLRAFVELRESALNVFEARGQRYRQFTYAQHPGLRQAMNLIHHDTWPRYFAGSATLTRYWERLYAEFPAYQFCLLDEENRVACVANGAPLYWDGRDETAPVTWDEAVERAFRQRDQGVAPNAILGLAGIVAAHFQGHGLSKRIVQGFRSLARMHGHDYFLAPVRPVGMLDHPGVDVHAWSRSRDAKGEPLDFWLRVHERLGARTLGAAAHSQYVEGTLEQWHEWTSVTFEANGPCMLPGLLQPVQVDLKTGLARYYDPSIWAVHRDLRHADGVAQHVGRAELREFLGLSLPAYMLPDTLHIVPNIAVNENGKIDARRMSGGAPEAAEPPVPPADGIQAVLVDMWCDVLKRGEIGIEHDFFLLGGQSLQVIEMLVQVERTFGRKVRLQAFYRQPTIRDLARLVAGD